jgi:hypothetical protein
MEESAKHSTEVRESIAVLRNDEDRVLDLGKQLFGAAGAPFFPLDLLAYAALKRNLSTSAALVLLVEHFNLVSARALLRVHIDTALRFSAAWFVDTPHDFASAVHGGARVDRMKDRQGRMLTDARLVELLAPSHPWLPAVYENLSGFVHFSGSHVAASIVSLNTETREVSFHVGKSDEHYPPSSWTEVLDCAHEATGVMVHYLRGYIATKAMSPEELAARRNDA